MRITNQMVTDANAKYMRDSLANVNKAQNQINSGKLFENSSEDPQAASFSLSLNSSLRTLKTFQDTNATVDDWMSASDNAFQQMEDISINASNLVIKGLNDTATGSDRYPSMYSEIDSMISQALDVANSTHNGQYLFSGFKVDQKPFSIVDHSTDPPPPPTPPPFSDPITGGFEVKYDGDTGLMQRSINVGQTVTQNVTGDAAFQGFLKRLVQAREALKSNDTIVLREALGGLQSTSATMISSQGTSASRWRQVQSTSAYLDKSTLETKRMLSQNEDMNLAEGITELRKQESNYQVVMEVTSRAISAMTLFDYLK